MIILFLPKSAAALWQIMQIPEKGLISRLVEMVPEILCIW